jgi:hypothetical protein
MARLLPLKEVKRGLFDTGGVTWTAFVVVTISLEGPNNL